jgi:hypothetical protein
MTKLEVLMGSQILALALTQVQDITQATAKVFTDLVAKMGRNLTQTSSINLEVVFQVSIKMGKEAWEGLRTSLETYLSSSNQAVAVQMGLRT